jgi:hypothetical protein
MLLEAAKTAKSPTYLARNVMELYDRCVERPAVTACMHVHQ